MLKTIRQVRRYRKLFSARTPRHYSAEVATSEQFIAAAKRLHARVYYFAGYLSAADIDGNGHISVDHDPHQMHSTYFVVRRNDTKNPKIIAAARQITSTPAGKHKSFQTIKDLELYPAAKEAILGIDPERIVEISALVKGPGVDSYPILLLYRAMWQYSLQHNHSIWLMACDERLYKRLKFLFGEALVRAGDTKFYKGHHVVPCVLEVRRSLFAVRNFGKSHVFRNVFINRLIRFFLHGIPPSVLKNADKVDVASLVPSAE